MWSPRASATSTASSAAAPRRRSPTIAFPRGSGSDFAGIVAAVGEGVQRFRRGAEVIGHVRSGAHASAVTVPAAALVHKPRSMTWEVAGGLYLAGATALDTLDQLRIGAGRHRGHLGRRGRRRKHRGSDRPVSRRRRDRHVW